MVASLSFKLEPERTRLYLLSKLLINPSVLAYRALVQKEDAKPLTTDYSFHARTHDTFVVTKGKLKVWMDDQCRILLPGDIASVPPVSQASDASADLLPYNDDLTA